MPCSNENHLNNGKIYLLLQITRGFDSDSVMLSNMAWDVLDKNRQPRHSNIFERIRYAIINWLNTYWLRVESYLKNRMRLLKCEVTESEVLNLTTLSKSLAITAFDHFIVAHRVIINTADMMPAPILHEFKKTVPLFDFLNRVYKFRVAPNFYADHIELYVDRLKQFCEKKRENASAVMLTPYVTPLPPVVLPVDSKSANEYFTGLYERMQQTMNLQVQTQYDRVCESCTKVARAPQGFKYPVFNMMELKQDDQADLQQRVNDLFRAIREEVARLRKDYPTCATFDKITN